MNSVTFIFSNEIQETFNCDLNDNLRVSKIFSMNSNDGILNNRWEIVGTKYMASLNDFVNNLIVLQKENKLEQIKISLNDEEYFYDYTKDIKQIEYYIHDERSSNLEIYQLNIILNI